ncbi:MAG: hypothetical protein AAF752_15995, partial [Bacteroidota bacterium]
MTLRLPRTGAIVAGFLLATLIWAPAAYAQLQLSEVLVNVPGTDSPNEFIEIQGVANSTIPAGTYYVNIDGDNVRSGEISSVYNLGGLTIGANGYLVLVSAGHPYTIEPTANTVEIIGTQGNFSEEEAPSGTYALITTSQSIAIDDDIDGDDDGTIDGTLGLSFTFLDAVAILDNDGDCAYASVIFSRGTDLGCAPSGADVEFMPVEIDYVGRLPGGASKLAGWAGGDVEGTPPNLTLSTTAANVSPSSLAGDPLNHLGSSNTPLPVELVSFEAIAGPDAIELSWSTATETNNAGFTVERALDVAGEPVARSEWREVAFVRGAGTTTEPRHYRHTVAHLAPGRHQFRLRQVDFDGAFDYSPIVEAMISVPGTHALSEAYPNPFNPQARFELTVATEQAVTVTLHDALGRTVRTLYTGVVA